MNEPRSQHGKNQSGGIPDAVLDGMTLVPSRESSIKRVGETTRKRSIEWWGYWIRFAFMPEVSMT
jgi:hypothetical protein